MTDDGYDLSRRQALLGLGTIGVASAGAGAGTFAYFSDTESSTGNQIQAGTLDLEVGNNDSLSLTVSDKAPGWTGSDSASINNVGSVEGGLRLEVNVTSTGEGETPESETSYSQSNGMKDEVWVKAGFGGYNVIDTKTSLGTAEMLGEIDALKRLSGSDSTTLDVEVGIDADATNEIQGDSITFEVVVSLLQKEPITVGSSGDYASIQNAVDAASAGDTVKLLESSYSESFIISNDGVGLYGRGATIDAGGAKPGVGVDANDVTVNGLGVENAKQAVVVNVDSTGSTPRKSGVALMDITVDGSTGNGGASDRAVVVDYSDNVVVNDVTTSNNGNDGFTFWYTNNSRAENVTANGNADNGVYFNGDNNAILHSTVMENAEEGVDFSWKDDLSSSQQRALIDGVVARDNGQSSDLPAGEGEDVELHDDGGADDTANNSKLLKNVDTSNSSAPLGLRLVQVAESEVQRVNSPFPNGIKDGNDNDVDP